MLIQRGGLKVVAGLGISGVSAVNFLHEKATVLQSQILVKFHQDMSKFQQQFKPALVNLIKIYFYKLKKLLLARG
jgi:UDP-N-acetylmuramoylalanine-D-glutamate ligase